MKGAPDRVIKKCTTYQCLNGKTQEMSDKFREDLMK
jgi:hypothetical protein